MGSDLYPVVALFGAPGAGKGTQSALLVERLKFKHFSVGDLLRAEVAKGSSIGDLASSYMNQGKFVPDYVVNDVVKAYFLENKEDKVILDGFPRTVGQAKELRTLLKLFPQIRFCAIQIDLSPSEIKERIKSRFMCAGCQTIYSKEDFKSQFVCSKCNSNEVTVRKDDAEEVVQTRIDEYQTNVSDLLDFYKSGGILSVVDGSGSAESVYKKISSVVDGALGFSLGRS
ncbi:MAG: nucleoside monophosphate kinase [Holosporales bacterium]|jgi:adenylate kinase|nr:nucleoside monophosphate kinase [Holosporales bacterium]